MDPCSLPFITIIFASWGLSDYLRLSLIIILIFISGVFACTETAFSCCNKNRINTNADNNDKKAIRVKKILDNSERGIIAVLIAINIAHVCLSTISTILFVKFFGESGSLLSTIIMTIIVFIFSESLPKKIAADNADTLVLRLAPLLNILIYLFYPLVIVFSLPLKAKDKIVGKEEDGYSEEDLAVMVKTINEEGSIDDEDSSLIQNAIEFDDIRAKEVYTPLDKVESISVDISEEDLISKITKETNYSRLPVYEGNKENIVGVVLTREILKGLLKKKSFSVKDNMQKPYFINEVSKLDDVLDGFSKNKTHIGFIVNNGKIKGLITMDDVLNELTDEVILGNNNE